MIAAVVILLLASPSEQSGTMLGGATLRRGFAVSAEGFVGLASGSSMGAGGAVRAWGAAHPRVDLGGSLSASRNFLSGPDLALDLALRVALVQGERHHLSLMVIGRVRTIPVSQPWPTVAGGSIALLASSFASPAFEIFYGAQLEALATIDGRGSYVTPTVRLGAAYLPRDAGAFRSVYISVDGGPASVLSGRLVWFPTALFTLGGQVGG